MTPLTPPEALHRAAAYCAKSEHCLSEIREKLRQWGIDLADANPIIEHLQREKYIDEARYCRSFVNDKYKYNRWGRIKIAYALRAKRIPDTLIYTALDENIDEGQYGENLLNLLREKQRSLKGSNKQELTAKLYRFAASRGFESDEISRTLRTLLQP